MHEGSSELDPAVRRKKEPDRLLGKFTLTPGSLLLVSWKMYLDLEYRMIYHRNR